MCRNRNSDWKKETDLTRFFYLWEKTGTQFRFRPVGFLAKHGRKSGDWAAESILREIRKNRKGRMLKDNDWIFQFPRSFPLGRKRGRILQSVNRNSIPVPTELSLEENRAESTGLRAGKPRSINLEG